MKSVKFLNSHWCDPLSIKLNVLLLVSCLSKCCIYSSSAKLKFKILGLAVLMGVKVLLHKTAIIFGLSMSGKKGDDLPKMLHMHWLPFLSLGLSFQGMMSCHA